MATRSIRERLRRVEEAKAKMDEPNITRLLYHEGEKIPDEAYKSIQGPVLIWDISGMMPDDSKEVDA